MQIKTRVSNNQYGKIIILNENNTNLRQLWVSVLYTKHMMIDDLYHNWLTCISHRLWKYGFVQIDFETLECGAKQGSNHV